MSVVILTGPSAAGKNAVAMSVAQHLSRCAVVDVDALRHMVTSTWGLPNAAFAELVASGALPIDDLDEVQFNQDWGTGIRATVSLASQFNEEGYHVLILDVLSKESVTVYRESLGSALTAVVQLLPSRQVAHDRFEKRAVEEGFQRMTRDHAEALYTQQTEFEQYDSRIDNTHLSVEQTAKELLGLFT